MTKERPILFSAPMVRAILDGSKTQTRRVAKEFSGRSELDAILKRFPNQNGCPYGKPGDRLWVRESWWQAGEWQSTYPEDDVGAWFGSQRVVYSADGVPPNEPNKHYPKGLRNGAYSAADPHRIWRHRPSIHMPRWASRILLEVVAIRVERLQDISEEQAEAEGVHRAMRMWFATDDGGPSFTWPQHAFEHLWRKINGAESWEANPWVWAVDFKRITPPALSTTEADTAHRRPNPALGAPKPKGHTPVA